MASNATSKPVTWKQNGGLERWSDGVTDWDAMFNTPALHYRSTPFFLLIPPRDFTGDAPFLLEEPLINPGRVQAPARGQQRDLVRVGRKHVGLAEGKALGRFPIVEAFRTQFLF